MNMVTPVSYKQTVQRVIILHKILAIFGSSHNFVCVILTPAEKQTFKIKSNHCDGSVIVEWCPLKGAW